MASPLSGWGARLSGVPSHGTASLHTLSMAGEWLPGCLCFGNRLFAYTGRGLGAPKRLTELMAVWIPLGRVHEVKPVAL